MDLRPLFKAFENKEHISEENLLKKCSPEMIKRAVDNGYIYLSNDTVVKGNCYSISNIGYKEEYKLMHRRPKATPHS